MAARNVKYLEDTRERLEPSIHNGAEGARVADVVLDFHTSQEFLSLAIGPPIAPKYIQRGLGQGV